MVKRSSKKQWNKVVLVLSIGILLIIGLTACGVKASPQNVSVKEIMEKEEPFVDRDAMKEMSPEKFEKFYGIDMATVEEVSGYIAKTNIKSDELLILKLKDKQHIDAAKQKIDERIEKQANAFKDYLPDEYYKIEKNVVEKRGNYILFVVSDHAEKIKDTFIETLK
jgi:hypothetical protein